MKTKAISSIFVLFAIAAGMASMAPAAFADHPEVTISTSEDAMNPACEPECYVESTSIVEVGSKVIFSNPVGFHSFTSGTMDGFTPNPTEVFDTGILNAGESGEWTPENTGEVPFYCSLHPYMYGVIIVQDVHAEEAAAAAQALADAEEAAAAAQALADAEAADAAAQALADAEAADAAAQALADAEAADVELMVTITDSVMGDGTHVYLEFSEIHVNYQITAMQNGEEIFTMTDHAMEMTGANHHIDAVGSDESPIDIEIVSLGIGAPGAEDDWTGPTGSVATTQVVPEFGTIAMMVLAVAIISIVAVTAKSRVVPRF